MDEVEEVAQVSWLREAELQSRPVVSSSRGAHAHRTVEHGSERP